MVMKRRKDEPKRESDKARNVRKAAARYQRNAESLTTKSARAMQKREKRKRLMNNWNNLF